MRKSVQFLCFVVALLFHFQGFSQITLNLVGTYETGVFDDGATEIVAFNKNNDRLYSTNGSTDQIDIIDISNPAVPVLVSSIDLSPFGKKANSVTTFGNWVAAAIENDSAQLPGKVVFFDLQGNLIKALDVGALPDHVTVSPNGKKVLVACEGEPDDLYVVDPEGTIAVINVPKKINKLKQNNVKLLDFKAFNNGSLDPSIRVNANPGNSTPSQDLEPEYCTISKNGKIGYVTLQENNALAFVNLKKRSLIGVKGLGFKNHNLPGNGFDASDKSDDIDITTHPVLGMYQPDAIASYKVGGSDLLVTANEGDARDYDGYSEEVRVDDLILDTIKYPNEALLQEDTNLGRLRTTTATGDVDGDGDFEQIYSYGARSFSIWTGFGLKLYDSGDIIEQVVAATNPDHFNANNDDNDAKKRSDDKGPEPEALELAKIKGRTYAFVGLERVGGVMIFDVTNPFNVSFVDYINNRDFNQPVDSSAALDLGPEEIVFIRKNQSPTNQDLLVVSNEVSGTISIFSVDEVTVANKQEEGPAVLQTPVESKEFSMFPNPATDYVQIKVEPSELVRTLLIFDMQGRLVRRELVAAGQQNIRVGVSGRDFQSGHYNVILANSEGIATKQLVVVR